jgi:hypothetical protein
VSNTENKFQQIQASLSDIESSFDRYFKENLEQELFASLIEIRDFFLPYLSLLIQGELVLRVELLHAFFRFEQLVVSCLTKLEDAFYRNGRPKSPLRAAMFNVAASVGTVRVPGETNSTGEWEVLDPRKVGSPNEEGEVAEAVEAYKAYQEARTPEAALELTLELADTIYNLIQGVELVDIIRRLDEVDPSGKLGNFGTYLVQIATLKFHHRYVERAGVKSTAEEKEKIWSHLEMLGIEPQTMLDTHYGELIPLYLQTIISLSRDAVTKMAYKYFENDTAFQLFLSQNLISSEHYFAAS